MRRGIMASHGLALRDSLLEMQMAIPNYSTCPWSWSRLFLFAATVLDDNGNFPGPGGEKRSGGGFWGQRRCEIKSGENIHEFPFLPRLWLANIPHVVTDTM